MHDRSENAIIQFISHVGELKLVDELIELNEPDRIADRGPAKRGANLQHDFGFAFVARHVD